MNAIDHIFDIIKQEEDRQRYQLNMIPSENMVSSAVRHAVGSVLMNKYSEGIAGKRYYQGNKHIDDLENFVKDLALQLYGLDPEEWGVIVQAATGAIANLAVLSALLELNDKMLAMNLYDGGHLSHGWKLPEGKKVSLTSRLFDSYFYKVDVETELFNYDEIEKQAKAFQPKIIISGGTAYPREIDHKRMKEIAQSVNAYYFADVAHEAGLIAAGVNKSPFVYADVVTMTSRKTLRGPIGALIFAKKELIPKIESALFPGLQGGPLNHSIAGIGVALAEASTPEFKQYAEQSIKNAQVLAEVLIANGFHVLTGGTDKHLLLIDLRNMNITGSKAATTLEKINIIVNKNTVPNETGKPWNPSGIRLGTPTLTTRGMKETEMRQIANWVTEGILHSDNDEKLAELAAEVKKFAEGFPVQ